MVERQVGESSDFNSGTYRVSTMWPQRLEKRAAMMQIVYPNVFFTSTQYRLTYNRSDHMISLLIHVPLHEATAAPIYSYCYLHGLIPAESPTINPASFGNIEEKVCGSGKCSCSPLSDINISLSKDSFYDVSSSSNIHNPDP